MVSECRRRGGGEGLRRKMTEIKLQCGAEEETLIEGKGKKLKGEKKGAKERAVSNGKIDGQGEEEEKERESSPRDKSKLQEG